MRGALHDPDAPTGHWRPLWLRRTRQPRPDDLCERTAGLREVAERKILDYVFGGFFTPDRVAYLERAIDAALKRARSLSADTVTQRERVLADARRELGNIADAIRRGILAPPTRFMLEDAERRVDAPSGPSANRADRRRPPCRCSP